MRPSGLLCLQLGCQKPPCIINYLKKKNQLDFSIGKIFSFLLLVRMLLKYLGVLLTTDLTSYQSEPICS